MIGRRGPGETEMINLKFCIKIHYTLMTWRIFLQSTEMYTKKQSSKNRAYVAYLVLGKFQLDD